MKGFDYATVVIGSGIAGLFTAFNLDKKALVVSKTNLLSGSTYWAQGGVAAALDSSDSYQNHLIDTFLAGCKLGKKEALEILTKEGLEIIKYLIEAGLPFDLNSFEKIALTKEAAHSTKRVLHAGGDATGQVMQKWLLEKVKAKPYLDFLAMAQVFEIQPLEIGFELKLLFKDGLLFKIAKVISQNVVIATGGSVRFLSLLLTL